MFEQRQELHREGLLVPKKDHAVWQSWTALFGSVSVYVIYFLLVYGLGEMGCKLDSFRTSLFGFPLVKTLSVLLAIVAVASVLLIVRLAQRLSALEDEAHKFMGRAGMMMSGLSLVMIVATVIFILMVTPC